MADATIDGIMADGQLRGPAKRARIFAYLAAQPDRGVQAATSTLIETEDRAVAEYLAQYLELIPGAVAAKTRAAERLRQHDVLVRSAARLVPWLPDDLLDGFVADYAGRLDNGESKPQVSNVVYTMAIFVPERLRPYEDRLENPRARQGLLSGAPDATVDRLVEAWQRDDEVEEDDDEEHPLVQLALVRTDYALKRMRSLREELDQADWELLVELAGGLPHVAGSVGRKPVFMGFVAAAGESPHAVGGAAAGKVPICHLCEAPAAPLLSLAAGSLPYDLAHDPVFYWYSCTCDAMDSTTVRIDAGEVAEVYYGPAGPGDPGLSITGGERSLVLEEHRNQRGASTLTVSGEAGNQVGGLPHWRRPDNHPRCPECGHAMPFLAFVDSGRSPLGDLDFGGIVYCFWCDGCQVSSTKLQD